MSSTQDAGASAAPLYFLIAERTLHDTLACAEILSAAEHPIEERAEDDPASDVVVVRSAATVVPGHRGISCSSTLPVPLSVAHDDAA